ncbi:acetolactate synthase I/II/III large subunit [Burkholderiales bacterium]|nr:acetolactate synthase I/II/III large subunit [Burkholderiales bacterium]
MRHLHFLGPEMNPFPPRHGGQILVDALLGHGVDHIFAVPGESYLAVLDALHDVQENLRLIVCRQEGGAANMAEAYGKLTGRPGICFVTRGPGATNASIGVHTAFQDSTPMILFIGQVGSDCVEREAFQEIDYRRMFGPMAKWVAQIDRADRIPELVSQAFHRATSGRPGPVVLALPEDMLEATATVADAPRYQPVPAHPGAADLASLRQRLAAAQRPLVIVGGSGWNGEACAALRQFIEANDLPVACAFRFQDLFDNRHPNYCGDVGIGINPRLAQRIREADLLLVIGARLGEMTTSGYTLLEVPRPRQQLIHIHAGAEELGRVYAADLMINASMAPMAATLANLPPVDAAAWHATVAAARADYEAHQRRVAVPGTLDMWAVMQTLSARLPEDAILTNGAGNYATWLHRYYRYPVFRTQLAPTSGAMGYGVPAAIAAKIVQPQRTVVCFAGDGCFLMNGQELATAVQYNAAVVFLVINNGMYGTIRMHQERRYPGRVCGTTLTNPDFAAYARAFGAVGETVSRTEDFAPALERALAAGRPALLELQLDPQAITPNASLDALRAAGRARA